MNNSSLKSYRASSLALRPFIPLCIMSQYGAFQLFERTHRETNFAHPLRRHFQYWFFYTFLNTFLLYCRYGYTQRKLGCCWKVR